MKSSLPVVYLVDSKENIVLFRPYAAGNESALAAASALAPQFFSSHLKWPVDLHCQRHRRRRQLLPAGSPAL